MLATYPNAIDDGTVHAVASLLKYRNDAIRYWIAEALGHFGARAKFAAPKLRAILDERESFRQMPSRLTHTGAAFHILVAVSLMSCVA